MYQFTVLRSNNSVWEWAGNSLPIAIRLSWTGVGSNSNHEQYCPRLLLLCRAIASNLENLFWASNMSNSNLENFWARAIWAIAISFSKWRQYEQYCPDCSARKMILLGNKWAIFPIFPSNIASNHRNLVSNSNLGQYCSWLFLLPTLSVRTLPIF